MNTTGKFRYDELQLFGQESARLIFRKLTDDDFDNWMIFCSHPDSLRYIRLVEGNDPLLHCKAWFESVNRRYVNKLGGMNALIEKEGGRFVGQCGLLIHIIDDIEELEIGYSLMPEFRGKGYAIEASGKCRDYAFENKLAESLISKIHPDNQLSAKVALKNGMSLEKQIIQKGAPVNIYRITRGEWLNSGTGIEN